MNKITYDHVTKHVKGIHLLEYEVPTGIPYVVCDPSLLEDDAVEVPDTIGGTMWVTNGKRFPLGDIAKLKQIAVQTIDHWRQGKQAEGYVHTDGTVYGSDERTRALCIGKIQEMQILSTASGIFPDIYGTPKQHTLEEMQAVGVGMAKKIEADYLAAVGLVQQLMHPNVSTLSDIEAVLAPVLGSQ